MDPNLVSVRYMVDDVDAALAFYTTHLGFKPRSNAAPAFADITRGNLRLLLSGPTSSAGLRCPRADSPGHGGWSRIHLIVTDISSGGGAASWGKAFTFRKTCSRAWRIASPQRESLRQPHRAVSTG
jgi:catechol 2,3-dioxygenase-like lactoylglutathione lyase family enzyme